jgi:hypothetical protein
MNAICGSSGLIIIGFMQVIEKLMGGLFALKGKYISGCKISDNKQYSIIILLRFVNIFKTMSVLFGIVLVLQLYLQSPHGKLVSVTVSRNVSYFGLNGTVGGRMVQGRH